MREQTKAQEQAWFSTYAVDLRSRTHSEGWQLGLEGFVARIVSALLQRLKLAVGPRIQINRPALHAQREREVEREVERSRERLRERERSRERGRERRTAMVGELPPPPPTSTTSATQESIELNTHL